MLVIDEKHNANTKVQSDSPQFERETRENQNQGTPLNTIAFIFWMVEGNQPYMKEDYDKK